MTAQIIIEAIRDFIEEHLKGFKVYVPTENVDVEPNVATPNVFDMYIPPKSYINTINNLIPEELIPAIIVGMGEATDGSEDSTLDINITFITYSAGEYDSDGKLKELNNKGYQDIVNLMEKVRQDLIKATNIGGKCVIDKPITRKIYDEQPYPYWYGSMTFSVTMPEYNYNSYINEL